MARFSFSEVVICGLLKIIQLAFFCPLFAYYRAVFYSIIAIQITINVKFDHFEGLPQTQPRWRLFNKIGERIIYVGIINTFFKLMKIAVNLQSFFYSLV